MKIRIAIALLTLTGLASAAGDAPRFEAATLKPAHPEGDSYPITLGAINGSRLNLTNVNLSDCLKFAWGLVSDDQISGPDWIRSRAFLYSIEALVPPEAPRGRVMLMTQTLLAERLALVLHHEPKELKYLALVPGKNGPKMTASDLSQERDNSGGRGRVTGNRVSMPLLASLLSRLEHQIVIDRTGIDGEFQIALRWEPGSAGTGEVTSDATGPSLFAAVQEQLGLKLEAYKGPLDSIVVDRAEKIPAEN